MSRFSIGKLARALTRRGGAKDRGFVEAGVAAAGAMLVVGAVVGNGVVTTMVDMSDGQTWLADEHGRIVQINPATGQPERRLIVGEPGSELQISQRDGHLVVSDLTRDVVTSIDLASLIASGSRGANTDGTKVLLGGGLVVLVDLSPGTVRAVDPLTLADRGRPFRTDDLADAVIDDEGDVWLVAVDGTLRSINFNDVAGVWNVDVDRPVTGAGARSALVPHAAGATVFGPDGGVIVQAGTGSELAVSVPALEGEVSPALTSPADLVPAALPGAGSIVMLAGSDVLTVAVSDIGCSRPGTPAVLEDRVYVPCPGDARVIVLNAAGERAADDIILPSTGAPELVVDEGRLVIQVAGDDRIVVVQPDGSTSMVDLGAADVPTQDADRAAPSRPGGVSAGQQRGGEQPTADTPRHGESQERTDDPDIDQRNDNSDRADREDNGRDVTDPKTPDGRENQDANTGNSDTDDSDDEDEANSNGDQGQDAGRDDGNDGEAEDTDTQDPDAEDADAEDGDDADAGDGGEDSDDGAGDGSGDGDGDGNGDGSGDGDDQTGDDGDDNGDDNGDGEDDGDDPLPTTPPAPPEPTTVSATVQAGEVAVTWTAPADQPESYDVVALDGSASTTVAGTATSVALAGVTCGADVTIRVTAHHSDGRSGASTTTIRTDDCPPDPATAARNVSAEALENGTVRVNWDAATSGADSYVVRPQGGSGTTVSGSARTVVISNIQRGTTVRFEVETQLSGTTAVSDLSNAVTTADVPGAVTGISLSMQDRTESQVRVAVSYNAASANGSPVTSYRIDYSGGGVSGNQTVTGLSTTLSISCGGQTLCSSGGKLTVTVTPVSSIGNGATASNSVSIPAPPPPLPSNGDTRISGIGAHEPGLADPDVPMYATLTSNESWSHWATSCQLEISGPGINSTTDVNCDRSGDVFLGTASSAGQVHVEMVGTVNGTQIRSAVAEGWAPPRNTWGYCPPVGECTDPVSLPGDPDIEIIPAPWTPPEIPHPPVMAAGFVLFGLSGLLRWRRRAAAVSNLKMTESVNTNE